ncbi:hypothetical protein DFP72DRAFT_899069 [Ephemerocybe angulata]|uniref:Uncharacterized protein n=1 Tax=Ephemerocybe angulata TaxID=980116 RepID=A0A8H6HWD5_9AGAR|nr:hypothetical protein DFP72DRAFT_899069 [Tulosesus angulatus]
MSNVTTSPLVGKLDGVPTRKPIISSKGRVCRNRWDAALDDLPTGIDLDPMVHAPTDEALNVRFRSLGIPESELAAARADWDNRMDAQLDLGGGKIHTFGILKPNQGEVVHLIRIPEDRLSIRFWDGGQKEQRQFFFDYVDLHEKKAVNSPAGYEVEAYPHLRHYLGMTAAGPIKSWEARRGMPRSAIPEGFERFSVPACTPCVLHRPGKEDFFFTVPDYPDVSPVPGVQFATADATRW